MSENTFPEELSHRRLFINRVTGEPVPWNLGKMHVYLPDSNLLMAPCVTHSLKGPINFYAATKTSTGVFVMISDDKFTRYYWLGQDETYNKLTMKMPGKSETIFDALAWFPKHENQLTQESMKAVFHLMKPKVREVTLRVLDDPSRAVDFLAVR